jgi:Rhs element Vgr protein
MATSPNIGSDGAVRVAIASNGQAVGDAVHFHDITIRRAVGRIPSALLVIDDGQMPDGSWSVADADTFKPGAEITISAGYAGSQTQVFKGVVVRLGMRIDGDNFSRLQIHCQDKAVTMTVGRKNANHVDTTDTDLITKLVRGAGLSVGTIAATDVSYGALVQYYASDWDFLLARAEANGLMVIVDDGKIDVAAPTAAAATLKVSWGTDIIAFDADIDARQQVQTVSAVAWDPKAQDTVSATATATTGGPGNLSPATLSGLVNAGSMTLQSATMLSEDALSKWAGAAQTRAGLARLRGTMTTQGTARARVGEWIEMAGVGARFNGTAYVSAVAHRITDGNWTTEIGFGLADEPVLSRTDVVAPPAAGWLPGTDGLQIGVVTKLDGDPAGEQRIEVKVPVLKASSATIRARLAQHFASNSFGAFYLPEIGDEVIIGYFNGDPSNPVVLGSLYSSKRTPPYALADENNTKALVTRSKCRIEIDDKDVVITIKTPAGNKLVIDDKAKKITISDQTGNSIVTSETGIAIDSPKDISITAQGEINIKSTKDMTLKSLAADLTATALNITAKASVAFAAKGAASAELSASGETTVRGAMVMIN